MTIDALKQLQKRIRETTGPDRELDWEIGFHIAGLGVEKERRLFAEMGSRCFTEQDKHGITPYGKARGDFVRTAKRGSREPFEHFIACDGPSPLFNSPNYTTDPDGLGACVALQRAVLPGWTRVVDASAPELGIAVELLPPDDAPPELQSAKIKGDHDLETHAHIDAIVSAAIAELEAKEKAAL